MMAAATSVARVLLEVVAAAVPLMMLRPFTLTAETEVLTPPENVIVAVWAPTVVSTGGKPEAEKGPTMVTTLPEDEALNPARPITAAVFAASVVELFDGAD